MKVLFLVPYTTEGASNRFRVEQYLRLLSQHGVESVLRPFLCFSEFYDVLYRLGHTARKSWYFWSAASKVGSHEQYRRKNG